MELRIIEKGDIEQVDVKPAAGETPGPRKRVRVDYDQVVERLQLEPLESKSSDVVPMTRLQFVAL